MEFDVDKVRLKKCKLQEIIKKFKQKERYSHEHLPLHSSHYAYEKVLSIMCCIWVNRGKSISAFNDVPVDEVPELLESVGASVLVVEVIGMLPYVECQQGRQA